MVNTPRTLREVLPALMTRLISLLASPNTERQEVASRTLGEVVKSGERVLPEISAAAACGSQVGRCR